MNAYRIGQTVGAILVASILYSYSADVHWLFYLSVGVAFGMVAGVMLAPWLDE